MSKDTSARDARIAELMEPMLKRRLWVAFSYPNEGWDALLPHLADHLSWLIALEEDGRLVASGPFLPDEEGGALSGEGMTIFRADTREEAEALAAQDPFLDAGVRRAEIRPWQMNEGSISVRVKLATGAFEFG